MPPLTLEGGSSGVVVYKVLHSLLGVPHLPAKGQGKLVSHRLPWVFPLRCLALVVHKVHTPIGQHSLLWEGGREGGSVLLT